MPIRHVRRSRIRRTSLSVPAPARPVRSLIRASTALAATLGAIAAHGQTCTMATLAAFNGTDGAHANGGLACDASGNLYGTTSAGGTSSAGTVFKIAAETNILTTLIDFTGKANGLAPAAGVVLDPSGNIYGTTALGGASNDGTVFKIAAGTNTLTTLATFNGTDNGAYPVAVLTLDSRGNLFGTTSGGGTGGKGTVFEIAAGTNTLTTIATFEGTNGDTPVSSLVLDTSNNLYGTTEKGGSNDCGTVFKIAKSAGTLTTIATFHGIDGANPKAGVTLDANGNLYGTTSQGGNMAVNYGQGGGTVFKIAASTGKLTLLATFNNTNGANPEAGVTLDANGNLYGTTHNGGVGFGTVFEIRAGTDTITTLVNCHGIGGLQPDGCLILDASGNLYGTTEAGGSSGFGTVFKVTLSRSVGTP